MNKKKSINRIIWYDLETTGFNPYHNNIIEIAAIDNLGNNLNVLLKIKDPLPEKIVEITNITDDLLKDEGIDQYEGLNEFNKFLKLYDEDNKYKNRTYLVAHNNDSFDQLFLKYQFLRYKINCNLDIYKYIDTFRLSQLVSKTLNSHSLKTLTTIYKVKNERAHRAMSDTLALQAIFYKLIDRAIKNFNIDTLDDIIDKIKNPKYD